MKRTLLLLIAVLSASVAFAAVGVPAFNATLTVGKESRFVLLGADGKASSWLKVGDSFEGYTIKAYDAKASALELEKDGKVTRVGLAADALVTNGGGAPGVTPATIADATAILDMMQFEKMLDRTLASTRKAQLAQMGKMLGANVQGADREAALELQKKMMEVMMGSLTGAELKNDVAKVYADVFTKEELQALGSFYSSSVGQAFSEKQPVVAEKMQEIMMPRIMAAMPKVQQMAKEFAAEQRARKAAAAAAANPGASAPTPTPAPGKNP